MADTQSSISNVFRRVLTRLRENDPTLTEFDSVRSVDSEEAEDEFGEFRRVWTNEEARMLVGALMKNTVVTKLSLCVDKIPSQGAPAFVGYVSSNPRLSELQIEMVDEDNYDENVQHFVDELFHAVLSNPAVKTLGMEVVGTPNALFGLLSATTTLTSIEIRGMEGGDELVLSGQKIGEYGEALVSGLGRNQSLQHVTALVGVQETIAVSIVSGLFRHPTLKTLALEHDFQASCTAELLKVLESATELKELHLTNTDDDVEILAGDLLLAHLNCTSLKRLKLWNYVLGHPSTASPSFGSLASRLESVTLFDCRLEPSLLPLQLLGKLKKLDISNSRCDTGNILWAEMIRSNPNLESLCLQDFGTTRNPLRNGDLRSIAEALCCHKMLKELTIGSSLMGDVDAGEAIRLLLSHNTSIEKLTLNLWMLRSAGATLLADGLRSNLFLKELSLNSCTLETPGAISILSAAQASKTLQRLTLCNCSLEHEHIGAALEAMLRNNDSLLSISLSFGSLGSNAMHLAEGLKHNSALKSLDLSGNNGLTAAHLAELGRARLSGNNELTAAHLAALSQALGINNSLEELDAFVLDVGAIAFFFQNLSNMHGLKRLDFGGAVLDAECIALILEALKTTNNTLESITGIHIPEGHVKESEEINFYLKLNQFGRRLLRNSEVPSGLWPRILERMTGPSDEDALFYFLRDAPKQLIGMDKETSDRKRKATPRTGTIRKHVGA